MLLHIFLTKAYSTILLILYTDIYNKESWSTNMLRWSIIFAVLALIASLLGFSGVAQMSKDFAVILLIVALILAIIGFVAGRRG
ncbi:UPF0391 membrane protein [Acinetobacter rudis CIP 110305]|uniref:UPF0391 membrane protein F945_00081 n=2 Tax=Acinetobacter rudis TaxID=632955 RepID=S3PSQ6_9GAMM|nr:UPF0391 membrane protein [Acinetobacter rudis CIP 110305]